MSLLALSFASLAPTFAGDEALHPASAEYYVEVPDVAAAYDAYGEAPLVRMFEGGKVPAFLEPFGIDVQKLWQEALAECLPELDPAEVFGGTHSFSASWSLGSGDVEEFGALFITEFESEELARTVAELQLGDRDAEVGENEVVLFEAGFRSVQAWSRVDGTRLVVGLGTVSPASYAARLAGEFKGYVPLAVPFGKGSGVPICEIQGSRPMFPSIHALTSLLEFPFPFPLPHSLDPFATPSRAVMHLADGEFITDLFSTSSASDPLLGGSAIEPTSVTSVPADVFGLYATTVNAGRAAGFLRDFLLNATDLELEAVEQRLGFSLDRPFHHLGSQFTGYMFPIRGIGLPASFAWIDIADPDAFRADLDRLLEALPELIPGSSSSTRDYRPKDGLTGERVRVPITKILLPDGMIDLGSMFRLTPTLVVLDNRLLVGVSSASVKRELKRIFAARGTEPSADPLTATGYSLPPRASSVVWINWGSLIESLFGVVRNLGPLLGMADNLPIDPAHLPDAKIFTRYLKPTYHASQLVEGGVHYRNVSAVGPEFVVLSALLYRAFREGLPSEPESDEPDEPPQDPTELTRERLASLSASIAVYQLYLGAYPPRLSDLQQSTEDFPGGFMREGVPDDAWGQAFHYAPLDDGTGYVLRSFGANGLDDHGGADDLVRE